MRNFQAERLRRLPQAPGETWQGGFVRLPAYVGEKNETPFRAFVPCWISTRTNVVQIGEAPCRREELDAQSALDVLSALAADTSLCGYRPARLEVNDRELAAYLADMLGEIEIEVAYTAQLASLDAFVAHMTAEISHEPPGLSLLGAEGITVERLRAFADAACRFYQARPWTRYTDNDLIEIIAPSADPALRFASVMGLGGGERGVTFLPSLDAYWRMVDDPKDPGRLGSGVWNCRFVEARELPFADADAWEDHGLPVAGARAYPLAGLCRPDGVQRPGARELGFIEGLMRALSAATDAELDAGRWTAAVQTFDGPHEFTLALPLLNAPPAPADLFRRNLIDARAHERTCVQILRFREQHPSLAEEEFTAACHETFDAMQFTPVIFAPRNAREEAQELCYDAFQSIGRRRLVLARHALAIDPDCVDALVLLAEHSVSCDEAAAFYARAVEAGRRAIGPERIERPSGFYTDALTRPFMRAMAGLASAQLDTNRLLDAIATLKEMLRLNPADNQGARLSLLPLLVETDRDDEAIGLWLAFKDDRHTIWRYMQALCLFRCAGDSAEARAALGLALLDNPRVPPLLTEQTAPLRANGAYRPGSAEEAAVCADTCGRAWRHTPGALEWLEKRIRARRAKPRGVARRNKKR